MARENPGLGYDRIVGALANLDHGVCDQTVANILRADSGEVDGGFRGCLDIDSGCVNKVEGNDKTLTISIIPSLIA
jgi:hypothetical protein